MFLNEHEDNTEILFNHSCTDPYISASIKAKVVKNPNEEREYLISGYMKRFLSNIISHKEYVQCIDMYLKPISINNQRIIAFANFIAEIINNYQTAKENTCPFMTDMNDKINLLDYIYIRGGSLRDILLNCDINDIDIIVDTPNLTQLQHDHLLKYHNKIQNQDPNCPCYLWQRYLKLYYPWSGHSYSYDKSEFNFLLNEIFVKDVIIHSRDWRSQIFEDHNYLLRPFSDGESYTHAGWTINIVKQLKYKGIDLNGIKLDICDAASHADGIREQKERNNIIDMKIHDFQNDKWKAYLNYLSKLQNKLKYGWDHTIDPNLATDTMINKLKQNFEIVRNRVKGKLISIHLPDFFRFNIKYSFQFCDFTINGIRLPLSKIYDSIANNKYIDFNWYSKIMKYSYSTSDMNDEYNTIYKQHNKLAIQSIKSKIIKQPHLDILTPEIIYEDFFWRYIKILTKFAHSVFIYQWKIDKKTLINVRKALELFLDCDGNPDESARHSHLFCKRLLRFADENVFISRLMVFRMIGIEDYLEQLIFLKKSKFEYNLRKWIAWEDERNIVCDALETFGYGNMKTTKPMTSDKKGLSKAKRRRLRKKKKKIANNTASQPQKQTSNYESNDRTTSNVSKTYTVTQIQRTLQLPVQNKNSNDSKQQLSKAKRRRLRRKRQKANKNW